MLPKNKRIGGDELVHLIKNGKRINTPFFSFVYLKTPNPHFSVVVSKNIYKKAIDRNKIKRLFYNKIRVILPNNGSGVFILKKDIVSATKDMIFDNIVFVIKKSEMI